MWSRVAVSGWDAADSFSIHGPVNNSLFLQSGFSESFSYEVISTCMPSGDYTASMTFGAGAL